MFTIRELATILAALQFWHQEMSPHGRWIMRPYFAEVGFEQVTPLNKKELARLMQRLRS